MSKGHTPVHPLILVGQEELNQKIAKAKRKHLEIADKVEPFGVS